MISVNNCAKAHLQLLSLCGVWEGCHSLHEFIFSLSSRLSGDYYDHCIDIALLTIHSGEHISKFNQRVIQLSTEITLANIPKGGMAELGYQFPSLLCSTNCPTLLGILTPYWRVITKHCYDPKHLTLPLPWTFKGINDDLLGCNYCIDRTISFTDISSTDPIVTCGSGHPFSRTMKYCCCYVTYHSDGSSTESRPSSCKLCDNKDVECKPLAHYQELPLQAPNTYSSKRCPRACYM